MRSIRRDLQGIHVCKGAELNAEDHQWLLVFMQDCEDPEVDNEAIPVWTNLMQPWAAIQQTQLVLDATDGCVLLICQGPIGCVLNVALQRPTAASAYNPFQYKRTAGNPFQMNDVTRRHQMLSLQCLQRLSAHRSK